MKEITARYCDLLMQRINCVGTITNVSGGLKIELVTKDYIGKQDFLTNFLNQFRGTYDPFATKYNCKDYKSFLKEKIEHKEKELEELKFAHKICGRKILD